MINRILKELEEIELQKKLKYLHNKENIFITYLLYLKYLCDKKKYNYDEVIISDELYEITDEIRIIKNYYLENEKLPVNRILLLIKNKNLKDLIKEYLNYIEKPIPFHTKDSHIIYLNIGRNIYHYYSDKGNATYITDEMINSNYNLFKMFDEVLGIHNTYILKKDLKLEDYDYVYVNDVYPKYGLKRETLMNSLRTYIRNNKNVILMTDYNKISNFKEGRFLIKEIKTIILQDKNATIHFMEQNESEEISIINYNKDKIKSTNDLQNIIKNNRKQKDILVKTNLKELQENNYRIGFKLYQLEKESKIKSINKIVDENTKYLKKLNIINENVEREINKLLNR